MAKKFFISIILIFLIGLASTEFFFYHKLQATQNQLDKIHKNLNAQRDQLSSINLNINQLTARMANNQENVKLSEITYLIRMANLRLNTQHDISSALLLLKQANQLVLSLNNPALESFRASLLKNSMLLQSLTPLDKENIISQLTQLRDQVPRLSILVAPKPNTSIIQNSIHQAHKKWWSRAWDNIKASFDQLVIIRHQSETIPAMMTPTQQIYLQENLQLLLMQAQWGLLNNNEAIYTSSLHQASDWVEKYYVQGSATTQLFLKNINSLIHHTIEPTLPNLLLSLSLLPSGANG